MQCVRSRSVQALMGYINRVNHRFSTIIVESRHRGTINETAQIAPRPEQSVPADPARSIDLLV